MVYFGECKYKKSFFFFYWKTLNYIILSIYSKKKMIKVEWTLYFFCVRKFVTTRRYYYKVTSHWQTLISEIILTIILMYIYGDETSLQHRHLWTNLFDFKLFTSKVINCLFLTITVVIMAVMNQSIWFQII